MNLVLLSHTRDKCPVNSRMRVSIPIPRGPQNAGAIQGAETHERRPRSCFFFFFFSEQFFFLTLTQTTSEWGGKKKKKHLRRL